ncbi:MAG: T9SS type A sorting domain-containing protein [Chitinophagaceae bacterium]
MKRAFHNHRNMAKTAALCCFLLSAAAVQAQITLTQSSYASFTPGLDSTQVIASFTATPSNNATWDLSTATYSGLDTFSRVAVSGNTAFPTATYGIKNQYTFNPVLGYSSMDMSGVTATGIKGFGQALLRQPIGLVTLTGGANDSIVFNQQNIVYSSAKTNIVFPSTAGTTNISNYSWDLNFNLSVSAYGLNNTPGVKRTYSTLTDTVKGWGKMRVKNSLGQASGYMDVLAIKYIYQQVDSFFLGGAPAPTALVTAFGLVQGQVSLQYYISYYRAGELTPLLSEVYTDNTYSTVSSAHTHAARLAPAATSVQSLSQANLVKVFPNPAINGAFNIQTEVIGKAFSYELVNSIGQKVASANLPLANGRAAIQLNQPTGVYYLSIIADGEPISYQPIAIQR